MNAVIMQCTLLHLAELISWCVQVPFMYTTVSHRAHGIGCPTLLSVQTETYTDMSVQLI